ncbi:MAG: hypothetical protein WD030_07920 [Pirellulales bacterium]
MNRKGVVWNFYDRHGETLVTQRNRPHWDQSGALTFVTFRLADSMPKAVLQRWEAEQQEWLARNGLAQSELAQFALRNDVSEPIRRQFLKFRRQRWHDSLDDCHGACVLREPRLARIVADSLLKFAGDRYDLERFVVMPNHVHLLVQMRLGWDLRKQCTGWLRFTGRKINGLLARTGVCWQAEPFDHVVRHQNQFRYLQKYIFDNPTKAKLDPDEYLFWTLQHGFHRC